MLAALRAQPAGHPVLGDRLVHPPDHLIVAAGAAQPVHDRSIAAVLTTGEDRDRGIHIAAMIGQLEQHLVDLPALPVARLGVAAVQ